MYGLIKSDFRIEIRLLPWDNLVINFSQSVKQILVDIRLLHTNLRPLKAPWKNSERKKYAQIGDKLFLVSGVKQNCRMILLTTSISWRKIKELNNIYEKSWSLSFHMWKVVSPTAVFPNLTPQVHKQMSTQEHESHFVV